jgi:hypothetical protein
MQIDSSVAEADIGKIKSDSRRASQWTRFRVAASRAR